MKIVFLLLCCWTAGHLQAQVKDPVKWAFSEKNLGNGVFELHLTATIEFGWHTYSQSTPNGGPVATSVNITANPLVESMGKAREVGKLERHFEKLFGVDVKQFSDKVDFVQKVRLKKPVRTNVTGSVEFMVCNDQECLPPATVPFSISLQ